MAHACRFYGSSDKERHGRFSLSLYFSDKPDSIATIHDVANNFSSRIHLRDAGKETSGKKKKGKQKGSKMNGKNRRLT